MRENEQICASFHDKLAEGPIQHISLRSYATPLAVSP